jgi:phosphoadenosine phosphosulfate reductase
MSGDLHKKVERAIKLIQAAAKGHEPIEVSYSGGKDSDVILELTKMACVPYRAIYKNTTIDPKGTIAHVLSKGAEVINPKKTFMQLIEENGFPNRIQRHCCRFLKEYKVLDVAVQGIRREESAKRAARYHEPEGCRTYGKGEKVRIIYPILDWTKEDVLAFIVSRGIQIHPLYYRSDGTIDASRRLGCQCCPLKSDRGLSEFKANPRFVKMWIKAGQRYIDAHPNTKVAKIYGNGYEMFVKHLFYDTLKDFYEARSGMFGWIDCKKKLEEYFGIEL